ncbi:MAG: aminotransferase class III-fold pyridoxal phosphate-dependent enzyme, partial [Alphaproteobacteria bacterium]|nr:aminotransferase class III-fold pyridoxal phosphate-dependent enzyme [Alphaproteobacteria bacterium]
RGQGEHGADLAEDLQRAVDLCGADTIAACIVEPIAGSTGCLVPPKGYLKRLRQICDKHGILLIFDEVICGFGRTGKAFGAQSFEVTPDILTMAKGITNGAVPMGAVAFRDAIYQAVLDATPGEGVVEFFHGYTYSGHPVACAAGLAALDIYKKDGLFERAAALSKPFLDRVFALRDLPIVTDIRGYGMLGALDMAPGEKPGQRGYQTMIQLFEAGVYARFIGETMILAPPFIAEESHLDEMTDKIRKVLTRH